MQNVTSARVLSFKTFIVMAITLIGLGASIANAQPAMQKPQPSGNGYNWTSGGLG